MFTITRLAISATKLERKAITTFEKIAEKRNHDFKPMIDAYNNVAEKSDRILYSKNFFQNCINWVKSFVNNYKSIKNYVAQNINKLKENYGELFTKKRAKKVEKMVLKSTQNTLKQEFKELKENKYGLYDEIKAFFDNAKKNAK